MSTTHYTYHAVGETLSYEGYNLVVKPQVGNQPKCGGCFFSKWNRKKLGLKNISCCQHGFKCTATQRKDKKHVIFAIVP